MRAQILARKVEYVHSWEALAFKAKASPKKDGQSRKASPTQIMVCVISQLRYNRDINIIISYYILIHFF